VKALNPRLTTIFAGEAGDQQRSTRGYA